MEDVIAELSVQLVLTQENQVVLRQIKGIAGPALLKAQSSAVVSGGAEMAATRAVDENLGLTADKVSFVPSEVITKSGQGKKGPWTLYTIVSPTGDKYKTFDRKLGDLAVEAGVSKVKIELGYKLDEYSPGKFSKEVLSLVHLGEIAAGTETAPF